MLDRVYISLSSAAHMELERTSAARTGRADKTWVQPSPEDKAAAHKLLVGKTEQAAQENHP
jgi:hypothetical protein